MNKTNIEIVAGWLKGKRRETFLESITALEAAEARGAWANREAQTASKGFYQGLKKVRDDACTFYAPLNMRVTNYDLQLEDNWPRFEAVSCINYGDAPKAGAEIPTVDKVPYEVVLAWFALCSEAKPLRKRLDAARPKPVVTPIGLSPKVTLTLTGMNLDLELPSVQPAEIEPYEVQARNKKGELLFESDGNTPIMTTEYRVKWSDGCKLGMSRFHSGCQACGKWIPSGRYVPIEADCKRNGRIGLWLGCDCARNIFGVKDKGIGRAD